MGQTDHAERVRQARQNVAHAHLALALAEAGHPVPEGASIGDILALWSQYGQYIRPLIKVGEFIAQVAQGKTADANIKGIHAGPANGSLKLHWDPDPQG